MKLNLTALATSLALGFSLNAPTLAQTKLVTLPVSGLLTAQYFPNSPGATPRPDVTIPGETRSRPNAPFPADSRQFPSGPYGSSQANTFQGVSKNGNFQNALSDALSKARQSLGVQRDDALNYRVIDVRGTTEGRQQKDSQLLVTIQVFPSGDPYSSNARQRSNFPSGQNPNLPPGQYPNFPSGQNPNLPPGQYPNFPSGQNPNLPPGQYPNFPSGQNPNLPPGQYPNFPSGQYPNSPPGQGGFYRPTVPPSYPQP